MREKTMDLVKAVFLTVVSILCLLLAFKGVSYHGSEYFPHVGFVLSGFFAIAFYRRAFHK